LHAIAPRWSSKRHLSPREISTRTWSSYTNGIVIFRFFRSSTHDDCAAFATSKTIISTQFNLPDRLGTNLSGTVRELLHGHRTERKQNRWRRCAPGDDDGVRMAARQDGIDGRWSVGSAPLFLVVGCGGDGQLRECRRRRLNEKTTFRRQKVLLEEGRGMKDY